ncbi:MAG: hypothetical protein ACI4Q3_05750 [Kiritimatiellia bacterium]
MINKPVFCVGGIVFVGLVCGFLGWCYSIRETPESRRAARREAARELKAAAPADVLACLRRLADEKSFQTAFDGKGPLMAFAPRVPYDTIGQFTEDQFIRFAGNGGDRPADVVRLKELLAFSQDLLARDVLSKGAAETLRERRLDGFFLAGDYDGAIKALDAGGLANRSAGWCRGTAAKLRAHKAMDAKDYREAVRQLLIFGEFMLSDEQKDFEDCDPTTGILYSRDWVVARNYMRCSKMSRELGDTANADMYLVAAKKHFASAHEKAKDDQKSLDAIRAEMKEGGFALPALPAKPQEKPAAK